MALIKTVKLTKETKQDLLQTLLKRSPNNYGAYEGTVAEIVGRVREEGDRALFAYTEQFDKCTIDAESIVVTETEIREAFTLLDADFV